MDVYVCYARADLAVAKQFKEARSLLDDLPTQGVD